MQNQTTSVVIIGGGMVGATLALILDSVGIACTVIEAFEMGQSQPSFDDRTIALSYGSSLMMENLGLKNAFCAGGTPITDIEVSQQGYFGKIYMSARARQLEALGYVLENRRIGENLHQLIAKSSIQWLAPAKVHAIQTHADRVEIAYRHQNQSHQLQAQLLIAADGVQSSSKDMLGVNTIVHDYGLSAVVCNVTSSRAHHHHAYECFCPSGPLAFLPLGDFDGQPRSSVVMTVSHQEVAKITNLSDDAFLALLQNQFGNKLGRLTHTGRRSYYKVALSYADQLQTERALVIGNAAQGVNPVAGQGFNLALRDIGAVVQLLAPETRQAKPDFGSASLLAAYSALRQADRQATIQFTDRLIKLFAIEQPLVGHARSLGMALTDLVSPLKQKFISRGMGIHSGYRLNIDLAEYRHRGAYATF